MAKYDYLNLEAIKHFGTNLDNSKIARILMPEADTTDFSCLRKHIGIIRKYGQPIVTDVPIFSGQTARKSLALEPYLKGNPDNILVIGDLHEPFTLPEYIKFCRKQQEIHDCGRVIFIGDIADNHYSSYHESDPDGYSAGEELDRTIDKIKDWYYTFPVADALIGNHDRLICRKAYSSGISKKWIREYSDVLGTPNWNFTENIEIFGIDFNHGEGGTAKNRMKSELKSQVQGHLHTQLYVEYAVGANFIIFGMQVGCGVDNKSYAMAYGKHYKKPAIGCGVVLNKGTLPIAIPMKMS